MERFSKTPFRLIKIPLAIDHDSYQKGERSSGRRNAPAAINRVNRKGIYFVITSRRPSNFNLLRTNDPKWGSLSDRIGSIPWRTHWVKRAGEAGAIGASIAPFNRDHVQPMPTASRGDIPPGMDAFTCWRDINRDK